MVFKNIKDIDLTHIFECGQCFRWVPDGPEAYSGAAGSFAAHISLSDGCLNVEATGGDEEFWSRYFDLDTDYGAIKKKLTDSEPLIKPATEYGQGIRILAAPVRNGAPGRSAEPAGDGGGMPEPV